ncbi:hypothetical protein BJL90_07180 [Clostridium formicaceticum]|nr:hypothetical protein BJL90_07180 [Clostridium formicaceticum]
MQNIQVNPGVKSVGEQGSYQPIKNNGVEIKHQENVKEKDRYTEEQLVKAVKKANESFEAFDRRLEITIHEATKQVMVKVINSSNDEVIREVPPEKILDFVAYMMEVAGLIVDKKV